MIESGDHCLRMAERLAVMADRLAIDLVFKASFDKANRSSARSFRGPGLDEGLRILESVRAATGLPVLSDVHETVQVAAAAQVLDVLQIPAFLCRQTDLLRAAARTGRAINVKKGQFLSPSDMGNVLDKVVSAGARSVSLTERGASFGYNNLVVDFRSLAILERFGYPVVFDVTHSVQLPGGRGDACGGESWLVPHLARAGAATHVDGFFFEVHDHPERALSDGPNALRLRAFPGLVRSLLRIRAAALDRS